ncbi:MAG: hypothetical protein ACP5LM_04130, partial [Thermoplasmata archaeon]
YYSLLNDLAEIEKIFNQPQNYAIIERSLHEDNGSVYMFLIIAKFIDKEPESTVLDKRITEALVNLDNEIIKEKEKFEKSVKNKELQDFTIFG